jgi:hypothetical protein
MSAQQNDEFLTVDQAAAASQMSSSALYDACRRKRLAHYRLSGAGRRGKILIRPADLREFIESCRVEAGAAPANFQFTHRRA